MRLLAALIVLLILGVVVFSIYQKKITNPEVAMELRAQPQGARALLGEGLPVALLIKGEVFAGQAHAVVDQPDFTNDVFKRLRPAVPEWLPDWLNGVLVVIDLKEV